MFRKQTSLLAVVVLFAAVVTARPDKTDEFIRSEMKRQNIPGLSLAVVKDGKVIKAEGYGLANMKLKISATPETVYRIASVSKQFIATGIMLLAQEGRLNVDDPISKYLEGTPQTWKAITIRHLLTHTSGLVREPPGFSSRKIQRDADVIKSGYDVPLQFPPGTKHQYSNLGYFALAEIMRKVSGQSWTDYLSQKVFKPSGMNNTYPTNTKENVQNRAAAYIDNEKLQEVDDNWPALRPSGAFLSTVLDMAKWDAMLYTDQVLTASSREQMWAPAKLNDGKTYPYGFGWELGSIKGQRLVYHGGGGPGIRTKFARFVDQRLSIIVLINLDDVDVDSIVYGIAAIYLPVSSSSKSGHSVRHSRLIGKPSARI